MLARNVWLPFAEFRISTIFAPYFCTRHSPNPVIFLRSSNVLAGIRTMSSSHLFCATIYSGTPSSAAWSARHFFKATIDFTCSPVRGVLGSIVAPGLAGVFCGTCAPSS